MANPQRSVEANERILAALEMRKAGYSYAAIAEKLGYKSQSGAFAAVERALKKTLQEPSDEIRKIEVERLDGMLLTLQAQIKRGDQGAIDRALRIMERRAKLLGLDAPTKQDIMSGGEPIRTVVEVIYNDNKAKPED